MPCKGGNYEHAICIIYFWRACIVLNALCKMPRFILFLMLRYLLSWSAKTGVEIG